MGGVPRAYRHYPSVTGHDLSGDPVRRVRATTWHVWCAVCTSKRSGGGHELVDPSPQFRRPISVRAGDDEAFRVVAAGRARAVAH